ncbi:MAG: sensor histidine kinase [Ruminococcus sp.]|nr:sensor histidine kinase [Ruminococcus sp.]
MMSAIATKMERVDAARLLETDGKYDPDKRIDILEYAADSAGIDTAYSEDDGTEGSYGADLYSTEAAEGAGDTDLASSTVILSEEDVSGTDTAELSEEDARSGLEYRLGDLVEWGVSGDMERMYYSPYEDDSIMVCRKPDGTYYYYVMKEFKKQLSDGSLRLESDYEERFLEALENGYIPDGENKLVWNADGELLYTDVWKYDGGQIREAYAPEGAKNILTAVNRIPALNGKLSQVYDSLEYTLNSIASMYSQYKEEYSLFKEGETNFIYLFVDEDEKAVYTNHAGFQNYKDVEESLASIKNDADLRYMILKPDSEACESNLNLEEEAGAYWRNHNRWYEDCLGKNYTVAAAVETSYPINDIFRRASENYNQYVPYINKAAKALVISVILLLGALVWLTVTAGRRPEEGGELYLHPFDRWKTELSAALVFLPWLAATFLLSSAWRGVSAVEYTPDGSFYYYGFEMTTEDVIVISVYTAVTAVCFLIGWLSLARRIKGRTLWKDSILRILLIWSKKAVAACFGCAQTFWRQRQVLWKVAAAYGVFVLFHWFCAAAGYGIPAPLAFLMFLVEAVAAVFLIRNALEKQQLKDGIKEIAAGSLDYKFPVKRENFDDPKVKGYLDILEMKAQRLKTLTEDVVEASKVSSGNISLEYMDVDLVEMLNQTIGELSEKMDARQLKVVASLPEEPAVIHVDGRRMWRVLENIFNNAAKYAMPGTRVYADLKKDGKQILFSLKNVSEQPLNFSSDELTERFIRGDVSRSTEGSGLGLSIAKSLTEMQGGKFELYLDGDLFKVTIVFEEKKEM